MREGGEVRSKGRREKMRCVRKVGGEMSGRKRKKGKSQIRGKRIDKV